MIHGIDLDVGGHSQCAGQLNGRRARLLSHLHQHALARRRLHAGTIDEVLRLLLRLRPLPRPVQNEPLVLLHFQQNRFRVPGHEQIKVRVGRLHQGLTGQLRNLALLLPDSCLRLELRPDCLAQVKTGRHVDTREDRSRTGPNQTSGLILRAALVAKVRCSHRDGGDPGMLGELLHHDAFVQLLLRNVQLPVLPLGHLKHGPQIHRNRFGLCVGGIRRALYSGNLCFGWIEGGAHAGLGCFPGV